MTLQPTARFNCSLCLEDTTEANPRLIVDNLVCADCVTTAIIPMFRQAVQFEHAYPPKFGQVRLEVHDYSYLFDRGFVARYNRREFEYNTPVRDRIYCKHKILSSTAPPVGTKAKPHEALALTSADLTNTTALRGRIIQAPTIDCGAMVSGRRQRVGTKLKCYRCNGEHTCGPEDSSEYDLVAEGLVQGKNFQICPNLACMKRIELMDGCNHMTCSCDCSFCFICQEKVDGNSDHWTQPSLCPRFGHPTAVNPIFDRAATAPDPALRNQLDELDALRGALSQRVRQAVETGSSFTLGAFLQEELGDAIFGMPAITLEGLRHTLGGHHMENVIHTEIVRITGPVSDELEAWVIREIPGIEDRLIWTWRALPRYILETTLSQGFRNKLARHRELLQGLDHIGRPTIRDELPLLSEMVETYMSRLPQWIKQEPISEQNLQELRQGAAETEIRDLFRFDDPATAPVPAWMQEMLTNLPRRMLENMRSMAEAIPASTGNHSPFLGPHLQIQDEYLNIMGLLDTAPMELDMPNLGEMREEWLGAARRAGAAEWTM